MEDLSYVFAHSNPLRASIEQFDFLHAGNYNISDPQGKTFITRIRKLLAFNPDSGNMLVKESTCCEGHDYEKILVISREGMPEKYKGDNF
jgi:hypothetical protein